MLLLAAVATLILQAPQAVIELDTSKLKGDPVRLAWSPDGSEFYVQTVERDGHGAVKSAKHFIVSTAAKSVKGVDAEPTWASKYWTWKSGQSSPASAALKIDVSSRQESVRATAAPTGGALARGGGANPLAGTTAEDVANATNQTQQSTIYVLKFKALTIGEWTNEPVTPGVNFTWAPAPLRMLAFTKRDAGPLSVVDETGRKQDVDGPKAALLPAWSDDGKRMAWLERKDKKKYQLMIADVVMD